MYQNVYLCVFLIKHGDWNLKMTNIILYKSINIKEIFPLFIFMK